MPNSQSNHNPTHLGYVLAVTFILSIGTGSLTHGLGFIAKQIAGFERSSLFGLGVAFGITYIFSSRLTGPIVRSLESSSSSAVSPKTLLMLITLAGSLVSAAPLIFELIKLDPGIGLWIVASGYGALTGIMWPLVEWNISGGRRGKDLRSAAGKFNIVWTTAVVVSFWLIGPTLEDHPQATFVGIVVLHLLAVVLMIPFPAKPPRHLSDSLLPDTPSSKQLLTAARALLPMSYTLAGVLGPFFPIAMHLMEVDLKWQTVVVSVWMTSRIPTMVLLERWHGWHGRAWPLVCGGLAVGLGFIGCVLAPVFSAPGVGLAVIITALTLFGAGKGLVYTAAIYYAMEVGEGEIDSGATHESLIGVGYALGPAIGLLASAAVSVNLIPESGFTTLLLVTAGIGSLGLGGTIVALSKPKR